MPLSADVKTTLTRKIGPLPAWGWGLAILGGIGAYMLLKGKGGGSDTSSAALGQGTFPILDLGAGGSGGVAPDIGAGVPTTNPAPAPSPLPNLPPLPPIEPTPGPTPSPTIPGLPDWWHWLSPLVPTPSPSVPESPTNQDSSWLPFVTSDINAGEAAAGLRGFQLGSLWTDQYGAVENNATTQIIDIMSASPDNPTDVSRIADRYYAGDTALARTGIVNVAADQAAKSVQSVTRAAYIQPVYANAAAGDFTITEPGYYVDAAGNRTS